MALQDVPRVTHLLAIGVNPGARIDQRSRPPRLLCYLDAQHERLSHDLPRPSLALREGAAEPRHSRASRRCEGGARGGGDGSSSGGGAQQWQWEEWNEKREAEEDGEEGKAEAKIETWNYPDGDAYLQWSYVRTYI